MDFWMNHNKENPPLKYSIRLRRPPRPKPLVVCDLFFQPLDNSNWTMRDLRWVALRSRYFCLFFTRFVSSE